VASGPPRPLGAGPRPKEFRVQRSRGLGDFRLRCGRVDVSFSGEELGWLVSVEGELEDADGFLRNVTRQAAEAVGEPWEWIRLGIPHSSAIECFCCQVRAQN
jgi:hypothetical protein